MNLYKKSKSIFEKFFFNFFRIKKIRSEIKKNPSIVISFLTTTNILTILSCLGLNRKIIINERNDPKKQTIPYIWKILRIIFYGLAFKIVKNIPDNKKEKNYFKNKTIFIPNPLMLEKGNNNIKKEKIILSVARLTYQKNIDLLLHSFSKSDAIKNNWKLIILGKGPDEKKLKQMTKKLNISKFVIFQGLVKKINFWYKKAGIFVLSSRFEGMPNALIEAIFFKSSIIGSDITGIKYFIKHNFNGLLFKNNNEESLTKCINFLIKNRMVRNKFTKNAYKELKTKSNPNLFYNSWINLLNEKN